MQSDCITARFRPAWISWVPHCVASTPIPSHKNLCWRRHGLCRPLFRDLKRVSVCFSVASVCICGCALCVLWLSLSICVLVHATRCVRNHVWCNVMCVISYHVL